MDQIIKIEPDLEIIDDTSYLTIFNNEYYSNEKYTSVEVVSKIKFIPNETKTIQIQVSNVIFVKKHRNEKKLSTFCSSQKSKIILTS